jgi:arabinofuranan 3-O-arabinosyltransferase
LLRRATGREMAVHQATLPSQPLAREPLLQALRLACFGFCVAHLIFLAASFVHGDWLIDTLGRPIPTDFVNVWATGKLALQGHPADAYDPTLHKTVENAAVGYDFAGHYGWHYPPPFLAVAALLALLPYTVAWVAWIAATFPVYVATMRWIVADRLGYLLAGAFPAVLSNMMIGQNGFLTASLIGGVLGFMERQPVLAGACLGLLTYKPHFGLLFPVVLVISRRWTVFIVASAVAAAMVLVSWLLFGLAAWEAFFHWLPMTSKAFLSEGQADWAKLQSVYGLVRIIGGGEDLAWALQAGAALAAAAAVCALWFSRCAFDLKAAALATATLLVTPYVYLYDMVVLAIAVAFFIRHVTPKGLRLSECLALAATALLIFAFPFVKLPVGLGATVIVAALIARRVAREFAHDRQSG